MSSSTLQCVFEFFHRQKHSALVRYIFDTRELRHLFVPAFHKASPSRDAPSVPGSPNSTRASIALRLFAGASSSSPGPPELRADRGLLLQESSSLFSWPRLSSRC